MTKFVMRAKDGVINKLRNNSTQEESEHSSGYHNSKDVGGA